MSIVNYKCDTCNREINITRNKYGFESFGRCIITDQCKGFLKQIKILSSFVNPQLPKDVENLNNWSQTKKLYTHHQFIERKEWKVDHYLGSEPSIQTFIDIDNILTETSPLNIITVDKNTTKIIFNKAESGYAQCISRSTNIPSVITKNEIIEEDEENLFQMSISNTLIFATFDNLTTDNVRIHWKDSNCNSLGFVDQIIENNSTILPWGIYEKILYKGKQYTIYNIDIIPPTGANDGSTFYFDTDGGNFNVNNSIILLTNPPFFNADIVKHRIVNMNSIDNISSILYTSLNEGNLFIKESKIKSIYPSLKLI